jgi:hypothetical protein
VNPDVSAALLHNSVNGCQAKSRSLPSSLVVKNGSNVVEPPVVRFSSDTRTIDLYWPAARTASGTFPLQT